MSIWTLDQMRLEYDLGHFYVIRMESQPQSGTRLDRIDPLACPPIALPAHMLKPVMLSAQRQRPIPRSHTQPNERLPGPEITVSNVRRRYRRTVVAQQASLRPQPSDVGGVSHGNPAVLPNSIMNHAIIPQTMKLSHGGPRSCAIPMPISTAHGRAITAPVII
jgi:hypothetical protein